MESEILYSVRLRGQLAKLSQKEPVHIIGHERYPHRPTIEIVVSLLAE
jgi:hypothetical protein